MTCPTEKIVAQALDDAGINYVRERQNAATLDFYLVDHRLYIEVCQFYTPRKIEQMGRVHDAILIQGNHAAKVFAELLSPGRRGGG